MIRKIILFTILNILSIHTWAQQPTYTVNDLSDPLLCGPVKKLSEYIVGRNKDTLRVYSVKYTPQGLREEEAVYSTHTELGFRNDTTCWKEKEKGEYTGCDCITGVSKKQTRSLGPNGLILQEDIEAPDQKMSYIPYYNENRRLTGVYQGRTKDNVFQFIGTSLHTYDRNGLLVKTSNTGGSFIQGVILYTYNKKGQVIKSVRTAQDKTFEILYTEHDAAGNWIKAEYQNGIIVTRTLEYY